MCDASSKDSPGKGPNPQGGSPWAGGCCCPGPMMEQMKTMMAKMGAAEDPMEACREMMSKCQGMHRPMAGDCCPWPGPQS